MSDINFSIPVGKILSILEKIKSKNKVLVVIALCITSIAAYIHYLNNGLGLAYNDARSHLDIGRRIVEGLNPGLAQLGSVWLPLPHFLMTLTIWNDFMWHSGLAGAIVSMVSYVVTGIIIYKFLEHLKADLLSRLVAVFIFASNLNVLYLQSTAMTELLLLATMTIASYELLKWGETKDILNLIKSAFWIMLSTLVRYDGWFLLFWCSALIVYIVFASYIKPKEIFVNKKIQFQYLVSQFKIAYKTTEGFMILFLTLAAFGIFIWILWNLIIFKDPLYFALGPFSAKAQQDQLDSAGVLQTKHNLWLSIKFYFYALVFNSNLFLVILGSFGTIWLWFDKKLNKDVKLCASALIAPLIFNIIALYFGHSVLFIQGLSGDTWFNVRYGIMLMPSIAIFTGYLLSKIKNFKYIAIGLILFVSFFAYSSYDAVTIDDALVGSSQKNVSEVSGWLAKNAREPEGFILISAASHDAIIFSSGLPMKKFIHEGTGIYWETATKYPDRWARWIIVRTYDDNDLVWKSIKDLDVLQRYTLIDHFPFADIYELKPEYLVDLNTKPILSNIK
ncbi:MAG: hypothetical protein E6Q58_04835 [Niabella sp.]|nr:MAG: hypothetical protein E6Q58_04835 [Niabella sp.]